MGGVWDQAESGAVCGLAAAIVVGEEVDVWEEVMMEAQVREATEVPLADTRISNGQCLHYLHTCHSGTVLHTTSHKHGHSGGLYKSRSPYPSHRRLHNLAAELEVAWMAAL